MPGIIMPDFHAFPAEATIIGRLLAFYGELEFTLALCVGKGLGDRHLGLRTLFGIRGETNRLNAGDGLGRGPFSKIGLAAEFDTAMAAIRSCLVTRNQFAHAHWSGSAAGLFFTNLDLAAKT